jgi:tetratricopeptide (TPR) repeat protein
MNPSPNPMRMFLRGVLLLGLCLPFWPAPLRAADALVDAKRKAAIDLLKQGKPVEAISIIKEIQASSPGDFRDQLLLCRALDRGNHVDEAAAGWKKLLEMLPSAGGQEEEREARFEAERRIRILDPGAAKLDAALAEFSKKLESLEKDPELARNPATIEHVVRLRAALDMAAGHKNYAICEVTANAPGVWTDTGVMLQAGRTYHIRAFGTWRVNAHKPETECTAAGLNSLGGNEAGSFGSLAGSIGGQPPYFAVGPDLVILPRVGGPLKLAINLAARSESSGSLRVYISP